MFESGARPHPARAVYRAYIEQSEAFVGIYWQHTPMLIDDRRGNCERDLTRISRQQAEQIAAGLATGHWPPDAARLPWVASAYPDAHRRLSPGDRF
jgi:hypothetical protein